jgi:hypothetical protein
MILNRFSELNNSLTDQPGELEGDFSDFIEVMESISQNARSQVVDGLMQVHKF